MTRPPLRGLSLLGLVCVMPPAAAQASATQTLLEAHLDAEQELEGWTRLVGASVGEGASSEASWADGAIKLEATAETERFIGLTRTVHVQGFSHVSVSARLRGEGLDLSAARFKNATVILRFDTGGGGALGNLDGTTPWVPALRVFEVPEGAREATIVLSLTAPGALWFDDLVVAGVDARFIEQEGPGALTFHHLAGDALPWSARAQDARTYREVARWFGLEPDVPVAYVKYPDVETKRALTGNGNTGHTWPGQSALHTVWASENHEIVHVVVYRLGQPPRGLNEGLATWLAWRREPETLHGYVAERVADGRTLTLEELLCGSSFLAAPEEVSYPMAWAMVDWLVAEWGREQVIALVRELPDDWEPCANLGRLSEALGVPAEELERQFAAWLLRFEVP